MKKIKKFLLCIFIIITGCTKNYYSTVAVISDGDSTIEAQCTSYINHRPSERIMKRLIRDDYNCKHDASITKDDVDIRYIWNFGKSELFEEIYYSGELLKTKCKKNKK